MYLTCFAAVEQTTRFINVRCVPTEKRHWYVAFYGFVLFCNVNKKGNEKPVCKKLPGRWWTKSWRRQISWTSCLIEETWGCWGIEATSWHFIKSDALWVNFVTGDGGFILVAGEHLILNLLPHWHRVVWSKKMFWNHHCYVHASSLCSQSTMICDVYIYTHICTVFSNVRYKFAIGRSGSAPKQGQHEGVFLFLLMGTMTMMASGDAVNPREKPWGTSQTL